MGANSVSTFQPNAPLTRQTLADLASGLQHQLGSPVSTASLPPSGSGGTTTTTTGTDDDRHHDDHDPAARHPTDARRWPARPQPRHSLGLRKAAKQFTQGARAAGLEVPGRFGTEVVARLLGLRLNHPAAQDFLELRPQDPATRAEAAYSAAQILDSRLLDDSWQIAR